MMSKPYTAALELPDHASESDARGLAIDLSLIHI